MSFRLPSLGFAYLAATAVATFATINYIIQPMFFEQPWGSLEKDLGEARYILRIVDRATPNQKKQWLPQALDLALKHSDKSMIVDILERLAQIDVSQTEAGLIEVYPGVVWAFGLAEDGWTTGTKPGSLLIKNPDDKPHRLRLAFSNGGFNDKGRGNMQFVSDQTKRTVNLTEKSGDAKTVHIETPEVSAGKTIIVNFRSYKPKQHQGRSLGIRFTGAEVIQ